MSVSVLGIDIKGRVIINPAFQSHFLLVLGFSYRRMSHVLKELNLFKHNVTPRYSDHIIFYIM